ncbi:hypothetical protein QU38_00885, partial [Staphylococcus aureus]
VVGKLDRRPADIGRQIAQRPGGKRIRSSRRPHGGTRAVSERYLPAARAGSGGREDQRADIVDGLAGHVARAHRRRHREIPGAKGGKTSGKPIPDGVVDLAAWRIRIHGVGGNEELTGASVQDSPRQLPVELDEVIA